MSNLPCFSWSPVAHFRCSKKYPFEAAHQATLEKDEQIGEIQFLSHHQFEQALDDLQGFSHLWVLFHFHHNQNWKPKVLPPRGSDVKRGVYATRSPYRPNPIGLSCVELLERKGLSLFVKHFDILDETPVLDIKPYIPYSDSFPQASTGWLLPESQIPLVITWAPEALLALEFLKQRGLELLQSTVEQQLSFEPLNSQKKRVRVVTENSGVFSYRTWRFIFSLSKGEVYLSRITTGYTPQDLLQLDDPYQDKTLHQEFLLRFPV